MNLSYGLGIAPAKTTFDFEKNTVHEGVFRVITDDFPKKLFISTEGDLADIIILDKTVIITDSQETYIKFKVNVPENLPPGQRKGSIVIIEAPKESSGENIIMATLAIAHQVIIDVPYPGKYVVGKMFISNTKVNEPVEFKIALANYGSEKVNLAKANIIIKGPMNEEIASINADEKSIQPGGEETLTAIWQTENAGSYTAEATVNYDGNTFDISQNFNVGTLELEIEKIQVNDFKIGQIAKLDIYLRNKWNKDLNVNGRVEIFKDEKLVSSFNSLPVDIKEKSTAVMEAYWNTEDIEVGQYDISVKANYDGKTSERTISSVVSLDEIQFKDYVSGKAVNDKESKRTTLLVVSVFVLILLNISLFIYINKRLKRQG
ncbi:MAG: hypothetical protein NDI94_04530, partial [Candidatus Woesearchaeota archaeon]|nr:hypothetical protein [Candidatus Woesearchaeota archaeon]